MVECKILETFIREALGLSFKGLGNLTQSSEEVKNSTLSAYRRKKILKQKELKHLKKKSTEKYLADLCALEVMAIALTIEALEETTTN